MIIDHFWKTGSCIFTVQVKGANNYTSAKQGGVASSHNELILYMFNHKITVF